MNVPERYRLAVVAATSLIVVVIVAGAILLLVTASPSLGLSTPEGAVRAFFGAFAKARRTDDPALIRPYVTGEQSSAYLSVQGFLLGQKAAKKASVLTIQQLDNIVVETTGASATVRLVYTEGGYDVSLVSGTPLESPNVLAPRNVTMELRSVNGRWLVDTYEARAQ
jgi:hypothetical protein